MGMKKLVNEFRKLPTPILLSHVTSKFVFGVGLGVLLAGYLKDFGWGIILLSFIIGIPSIFYIFHLRDYLADLFSKKTGRGEPRKKGGGNGKSGINLYVGNLSREVNEQELRKAFEPFGKIASVKVIKDKSSGNSRGFGFVEMPVESEARAAITSMNNRDLKGRKLNVNVAIPKSERSGGGGKRRRHR